MTGSERDVYVEERARRLLNDDRAVAAYARFVDAQMRYRRMLGGLRALARAVMAAAVAVLSAGALMGRVPGPAPGEEAMPWSMW
jgi:hypothetical protein